MENLPTALNVACEQGRYTSNTDNQISTTAAKATFKAKHSHHGYTNVGHDGRHESGPERGAHCRREKPSVRHKWKQDGAKKTQAGPGGGRMSLFFFFLLQRIEDACRLMEGMGCSMCQDCERNPRGARTSFVRLGDSPFPI